MKKKLIVFIFLFILSISFVYAKERVTLDDCIDGDTIKVKLNDQVYTVRMLAVDTPESVHPTKALEYYGKEASNYTCNAVKGAKKIQLEYDDNSDKTDKYDRLLAWVFIDGELLQEKLVENGYAKVAYLYGDYKYTNILLEKQELASANEIGIWNEEAAALFAENSASNASQTISNNLDSLSTKEIIIIVILFLIIVFVGDKSIKKKAKKKLSNYLD